MRRLVAAVLTMGMVAAACGSDDPSSGETPSSTASTAPSDATTSQAGETFPVTVEHQFGTTVIEHQPVRVVTLGGTDHDPVLALGVTPVAVANWRGTPYFPWNTDRVGAEQPIELTDPGIELNLEAVAAADPDVIFALWSNISEQDYEQLSQIAPTIAQPAGYPNYGAPWQVTTTLVGDVLGERAAADLLVADVAGLIEATAAQHPELAGTTVTIAADFGDGNLYLTPPDDQRYGLLEGLGMDIAPASLAGFDTLSFEQVDLLNGADVVLWLTLPEATIDTEPLYLAQPVHTEGRDVFLGDLGIALTFSSVLSIPYTLDALLPALVAAADGDPATPVPPLG